VVPYHFLKKAGPLFLHVLAPRGAWLRQKSCRAGGRGCAKNPADRKFTLSFRFAFHWVPQENEINTARRLLKIGFALADWLYSESLTKSSKSINGWTK
jgi:hypothetical protein